MYKGEIMLNNLNNSQVSFNGSIHQLNRLSKKLSDGKTITKLIDGEYCKVPTKIGGELANFTELTDGRIYVNLAKPADIKNGDFLVALAGIGKTKSEAARDFLNKIKDGVKLVTDAYGSARAEYFVQQGKHGLDVKTLNIKV